MIGTIVQLLFFLLVPAAALWLEQHVRVVAVMGSVALCDIIGFVIGNTPSISIVAYVATVIFTSPTIHVVLCRLSGVDQSASMMALNVALGRIALEASSSLGR